MRKASVFVTLRFRRTEYSRTGEQNIPHRRTEYSVRLCGIFRAAPSLFRAALSLFHAAPSSFCGALEMILIGFRHTEQLRREKSQQENHLDSPDFIHLVTIPHCLCAAQSRVQAARDRACRECALVPEQSKGTQSQLQCTR